MNSSEHSTSFDFTGLLRTCRFLDTCEQLLEVDGCRTCELALRYNYNTEDIYSGVEEHSTSGANSPDLIGAEEEDTTPPLPPTCSIDR
jgi:hypothetical protein